MNENEKLAEVIGKGTLGNSVWEHLCSLFTSNMEMELKSAISDRRRLIFLYKPR